MPFQPSADTTTLEKNKGDRGRRDPCGSAKHEG